MTALTSAVTPEVIVLASGAIVAGIVQGVAGFAFGMVAMSVWIWFVDPREAVVMAVFGGLCGQVVGALASARRTTTRELAPFVIGGLCGVPLGTWLLPRVDIGAFRLVIGTLLVVGCPLMLVSGTYLSQSFSRRVAASVAVGAGASGFAGGVIGGLSGFTGIAPAVWCTLRGYDKYSQRSLLQSFNLATLAATLAVLVWNGSVTGDMVPHLGVVAAAVVLPALLGARIHGRLGEAALRRIILVLLTVSGAAIALSALSLRAA